MEIVLKKQIIGFDYLRVLACFMVVFLHVSYTNDFFNRNKDITYIAVPEFVILSVFLLGNKNDIGFNKFIKRLFYRIAPQYIFWTCIYLLLYIAKCKIGDVAINIDLTKIFLGGSAVQLWYLPALLLWQLTAYFLFRYKNNVLDVVVFVALFILAFTLIQNGFVENEFLKSFLGHFPYVILAKIIFVNQGLMKEFHMRYLFFFIGSFFVTMYTFEFFNLIYAVSLCLVSVFVFILFYKLQIKSNHTIRILSKLSFGVYLVHFGVYQVIIMMQKIANVDNSGILITLINIFTTCVLSVLISFLFSKNKYLSEVI